MRSSRFASPGDARTTVRPPRQAALRRRILLLVADDPRPLVAVRVARPFATEDELFEHEPETLSRTSITLLGAQSRPQGVVLRFELVLSSGQVVVRGEGRVVGYKMRTEDGLGALTLRFTRLDLRSKALVDKAASLRDRRRSASPFGVEDMAPPSFSPPAPFPPSASFVPPASVVPPPSFEPPSFDIPPGLGIGPEGAVPGEPAKATRARPAVDRDLLLERLRARAQRLAPDAVQKLLEPRRRT